MNNLDKNSPRLKLEYPCQWVFKVIGPHQESIRKAIGEIIKGKEYEIDLSNKSRKGKYCCINIDMMIDNEEERDAIYKSLKANSHIIMVL